MSTDASGSGTPRAAAGASISLSKRVNETLPPLTELLSAHDLARPTRRPRWLLAALTLLRQFPKPQRFRGRAVGWRPSDVESRLQENGSRGQTPLRAAIRPADAVTPREPCADSTPRVNSHAASFLSARKKARQLRMRHTMWGRVMNELNLAPVVVPARYVLLPLANTITGYTVKAMERKIERGDWR